MNWDNDLLIERTCLGTLSIMTQPVEGVFNTLGTHSLALHLRVYTWHFRRSRHLI